MKQLVLKVSQTIWIHFIVILPKKSFTVDIFSHAVLLLVFNKAKSIAKAINFHNNKMPRRNDPRRTKLIPAFRRQQEITFQLPVVLQLIFPIPFLLYFPTKTPQRQEKRKNKSKRNHNLPENEMSCVGTKRRINFNVPWILHNARNPRE